MAGISPEYLRSCLRYLTEEGYVFLSLEALVQTLKNQEPPPENAVVFTMDDGYLDQARLALPIFLEFNCPVTFFLISTNVQPTEATFQFAGQLLRRPAPGEAR